MADGNLTTNDEADDNIERQRNELELLQTMYPDELCISHRPGSEAGCELEFRVDATKTLSLSLPQSYPRNSKADTFLSFGPTSTDDNATRRRLRSTLQEIVGRQEPGIECVDLILSEFRQAVEEDSARHTVQDNASNGEVAGEEHGANGLRVVLWMHHLLATSKRKGIVQLGKELSLAGYSKPGYPGSVYVEGEADSVNIFVEELKSWRWQAIQERASVAVPVAELALLAGSKGIEEVSGLGEIVEGLKHREKGGKVAELYIEAMKIK